MPDEPSGALAVVLIIVGEVAAIVTLGYGAWWIAGHVAAALT